MVAHGIHTTKRPSSFEVAIMIYRRQSRLFLKITGHQSWLATLTGLISFSNMSLRGLVGCRAFREPYTAFFYIFGQHGDVSGACLARVWSSARLGNLT